MIIEQKTIRKPGAKRKMQLAGWLDQENLHVDRSAGITSKKNKPLNLFPIYDQIEEGLIFYRTYNPNGSSFQVHLMYKVPAGWKTVQPLEEMMAESVCNKPVQLPMPEHILELKGKVVVHNGNYRFTDVSGWLIAPYHDLIPMANSYHAKEDLGFDHAGALKGLSKTSLCIDNYFTLVTGHYDHPVAFVSDILQLYTRFLTSPGNLDLRVLGREPATTVLNAYLLDAFQNSRPDGEMIATYIRRNGGHIRDAYDYFVWFNEYQAVWAFFHALKDLDPVKVYEWLTKSLAHGYSKETINSLLMLVRQVYPSAESLEDLYELSDLYLVCYERDGNDDCDDDDDYYND